MSKVCRGSVDQDQEPSLITLPGTYSFIHSFIQSFIQPVNNQPLRTYCVTGLVLVLKQSMHETQSLPECFTELWGRSKNRQITAPEPFKGAVEIPRRGQFCLGTEACREKTREEKTFFGMASSSAWPCGRLR